VKPQILREDFNPLKPLHYENKNMPSSELLRCEECGQEFDTIDSLREHQKSEREDEELRNRGIDR
jgi:transcription initiation factor IIE alpha subunit